MFHKSYCKMSAYRLGVLRYPFRVQKVILPKHRNLSDSCDGSDKQDSSESEQDQDSSSTTESPAPSSSTNPSAPSTYESRKYGHNLPMDSVMPQFETIPWMPTGIFRCTSGEVLGAGASKDFKYQNPEYFSYHHMTFYDMHLLLRSYRKECPDTGRKK